MKRQLALALCALILTACGPRSSSEPVSVPTAPKGPATEAPPAPQPVAPAQPAPEKPAPPAASETPATGVTLTCGTPVALTGKPVAPAKAPAGWEQTFPRPTSRQLNAVIFGHGLFVAAGEAGTLLSSPDGERWSLLASGHPATLNAVAYGFGRLVAVGQSGTIFTSADGQRWMELSLPDAADLTDVAFGNGRFLALTKAGGAAISPDGERWATCTRTGPAFERLTFQGALFTAFGPGGGNGKDQPPRPLYTSPDGLTWAAAPGLTAPVQFTPALVHGDGRYLVLTDPEAGFTSADGVSWQVVRLDYEFGGGHWGYAAAAFGNGRFLTAATACDPGGCATNLLASVDGAKWASVGFTTHPLKSLTVGNGRFVGVGQYGVMVTHDGTKRLWQNTTTLARLANLTYGNGRFVAIGPFGSVVVSADGRTWSQPARDRKRPWLTSQPFLLHGGGLFVAAGVLKHTGWVIYTSANGEGWAEALNVTARYGNAASITGLSYQDGQVVVTLKDGRSIRSADGKRWELGQAAAVAPQPSTVTIAGETVVAAAQGGGRLVALTARGELWVQK